VLTHLARDVGKNLVAISQLNAEHSVGQRFGDRTFDLDDAVFFGHNSLIALLGITGLADAKLASADTPMAWQQAPKFKLM